MDHHLLPSEENFKNFIFYSPTCADEDLLKQKGGKWCLFAPKNIAKLDDWWPVLRKLCDNGTLIAIKASTATDQVECVAVCYTPDFENEKEVKKAADEIRKLIEYKHTMHYKIIKSYGDTNSDPKGRRVYLYVHTTTGEFYKQERTFLLPSEVYWKNHYYYFGTPGYSSTEELKQKSGKWIFASGDIKKLDQRFLVIKNLCDNGTLTSFSTSTIYADPMTATIRCFTSDFENATEVKKAADEIRKLLDHEYPLYYSTHDKYTTKAHHAFVKGEYKYMHTVKGGFYKKDKYMRWSSLLI